MRTFLVFFATVVVFLAVAMPNHFREAVHHVEFWIESAVDAIF